MNREMRRLMEREERREKKQKKKDNGEASPRRSPGAAMNRPIEGAERKPLWRRLVYYLHEVRVELKKVSWPSRDQMIAFTTVTLVTTIVITLVVFGLDIAMKNVVLVLIGGVGS